MKMKLTVRNMCSHVDSLAKAFDICLVFDSSLPRDLAGSLDLTEVDPRIGELISKMGLPTKSVIARPIDDITSYVVVVHEIGHHLAPNGRSRAKKPMPGSHPRLWYEFFAKKLIAEEAAWEWARYYVDQVFEWTVEMEMVQQQCFATYAQARLKGGRQ